VVNAIAHIDVEASRLTKQRFVAGSAASVAVKGGVILGIRLRFHKYAPKNCSPLGWHFTSRQPISSGATTSAGRAKKDWGSAGRVLVAMGVAWGNGLCGDSHKGRKRTPCRVL